MGSCDVAVAPFLDAGELALEVFVPFVAFFCVLATRFLRVAGLLTVALFAAEVAALRALAVGVPLCAEPPLAFLRPEFFFDALDVPLLCFFTYRPPRHRVP